jgi:Cid1 family poly A polymerase
MFLQITVLHWSCRFDFGKEVVCVAEGRTKRKADLAWVKKIGTERHLCCIQDPFLTSHDLGRCVSTESLGTLQQELASAANIMYRDDDPMSKLMQVHEGVRDRGKRPSGRQGQRGGKPGTAPDGKPGAGLGSKNGVVPGRGKGRGSGGGQPRARANGQQQRV